MGDAADDAIDCMLNSFEFDESFWPDGGSYEDADVYLRRTKRPSGPGACPKCGSETKLKSGSRGAFYGCVQFPKCKGSRDAQGDEYVTETCDKHFDEGFAIGAIHEKYPFPWRVGYVTNHGLPAKSMPRVLAANGEVVLNVSVTQPIDKYDLLADLIAHAIVARMNKRSEE